MRSGRNDRRERRRFSYALEAGKETRDLGTAWIKDISSGGASIECAEPLPSGTFLEMEFKVRSIPVEIGAEIVWSVPEKGVGVRFRDLTPGTIALISDSLEDVVLVEAHREPARALAAGGAR